MPAYPFGALLIPSDERDVIKGSAVVLDPTTGAVLATLPTIPHAGAGARLPSGVVAITTEIGSGISHLNGVNIYTSTVDLVAAVPFVVVPPYRAESPLAASATNFYLGGYPDGLVILPVVTQISPTGVKNPATWTLPSHFDPLVGMAITPDEKILYGTSNDFPLVIWAYDLVNRVELPPVVTLEAGTTAGLFLYVVNRTELLLLLQPSNVDVNWEARRYSATGTLLKTYPLGDAGEYDTPEMWLDPNPSVFWVRRFTDPADVTSNLQQIDLATGTVLRSFTVQDMDGGGDVPTTCPVVPLGAALGSSACPVGIPSPPPTNTPACAPSGISGGQG